MLGLVDAYAQGVSPPKAGGYVADPSPIKLIVQPMTADISGTFVAPAPGRYQFALHGAGANRSNERQGGPGGLAIRTVRLTRGQSVAYTVAHAIDGGIPAPDSSVTFSDRTMRVTGAGSGDDDPNSDGDTSDGVDGLGGVATGGDINMNGSDGSNQAPSYGAFVGAVGASSGPVQNVPGAPGRTGLGPRFGGSGRLIIVYIGP